MYIHRVENFPVVEIDCSRSMSVDESLAVFSELLLRKQPFVFIGSGSFQDEQNSHEDRKKVALWVKAHKAELTAFVQAMIYIQPDKAIQAVLRQFAENYEKFSGYPMIMVENAEQANQTVQSLLSA